MPESGHLCLGDAVTQFLARYAAKGAETFQQPLQRFVRWCGRERAITELTPWEIEAFGQNSGVDSIAKLAPVKTFLAYAHKEGMIPTNLAVHLKVKRAPARHGLARQASTPPVRLSLEGRERVKVELEALKARRVQVAHEVQRAMADKDFRENAPLEAARDQQAHLEARIRELEQTLRYAQVVEVVTGVAPSDNHQAKLGSRITVHDLEMGEELAFTLVDPKEVDLVRGNISVDSPAGRAFLHRAAGEVVEVVAPAGVLRYRIERIER